MVVVTDIGWRLLIDGKDWSCDALVSWSVEMGRRDADSFPDVGRGRWTLMLDGGDRARDVRPGSMLQFSASVDGGGWLPVATMVVADVTRSFEQPGAWNTIGIDAEGVSVMLGRSVLPQGWRHDYVGTGTGASPFEEADGSRVAAALQLVTWPDGTPVSTVAGRTAVGHTLHDDWPGDAGRWSDSGTYNVSSSVWTEMRRSAGQWPTTTGWHELELRFTLDGPALVWQEGGQSRWYSAGAHRLVAVFQGAVMPRFWVSALDHAKSVQWVGADSVTNAPHRWQDTQPSTLTWTGVDQRPGSGSSAVLQLTGVDGWDIGVWPWGGDYLIERPVEDADAATETVLQHVSEVCAAVRSVLWESRDGSLSYTQRGWRASAAVQVTVDACDVETPAVTLQSYASVRNRVTQEWGYPSGGKREAVTVEDPLSQSNYGLLDRSNRGPLRDEAAASAIAGQVLAGHKTVRELVSSLPLKRLEYLPAPEAELLLRMPLGSRMQVVNGPAGWLASTWDGFVEGFELAGDESGTRMVLQVSDRSMFLGLSATVLQRTLSTGPSPPSAPVTVLSIPAPPGQ